MIVHRALILALVAGLACDHEVDDESTRLPDPPPAAAPAQATSPEGHAPKDSPSRAMPGAREAFARALEMIDARYVDPALDRDALYTGALEGALARLYQQGEHPINALLDPRELAELTSGTEGALVGIGVEIELSSDVLVVRGVVPDSPAARAGLQRGDRILRIDGARAQGLPIVEIVGKIRGEAGTEVDLLIQRDTEEWHQKLRRESIALSNVESRLLPGGLGYLRLRGFAGTTPDELDAALAELEAAGMRALILDLRHSPGGLLDAAVAVAGRFLAQGDAIVTVLDRAQEKREHLAAADGRWRALPIAALIGPETASGAEILADALAAHGRATLIGQPTFGKGTVESIHELGNGWALKLSTGRFLGASGEALQGRGVRPELPVPAAASPPLPLGALESADDPALSVARTWLAKQAP